VTAPFHPTDRRTSPDQLRPYAQVCRRPAACARLPLSLDLAAATPMLMIALLTECAGELAPRLVAQPRMPTAREMIRPRVTSEISACVLISAFAGREIGIVSAGLNAVAVVTASAR
jgi:hypothetical protein